MEVFIFEEDSEGVRGVVGQHPGAGLVEPAIELKLGFAQLADLGPQGVENAMPRVVGRLDAGVEQATRQLDFIL